MIETLTLQWAGCFTGVLGSALLAVNSRVSGWGFVAYLISNVFWVSYALYAAAPGLLAQQAVFTATSLIGVWRWLLRPALMPALSRPLTTRHSPSGSSQ